MALNNSHSQAVLEPRGAEPRSAETRSAEPRKILFFHYGENWIRGSEEMLLQLLKNIDREKFEPVLVCNQEILQRAVESMGIRVHKMHIPEIMLDGRYVRLGFFSYFKSYARLRGIIKREQPELLYCNSGLPCQLGVPAARRSGIPILCHFHHVPASRRRYWILLVKYTDTVVFPSYYVHQRATSACRFSHDTTVVYNGIDNVDQYHPVERSQELRRSLGIKENEVVIGQVGSLIHRKGYDLLIRSFGRVLERVPECKLVLVGAGEKREELEAMARDSGYGDKITLTGEVDRVEPYMQEVFDINVLASRDEGLGLVVLQGAACELPCVVTDCTGVTETVEEGVTGFHFDLEDTEMLADRLARLAADADLRREMGAAGRSMVDRRFSIASYVLGIEDVIAGTLSRVAA